MTATRLSRQLGDSKGFTFIELMIAIGIAALSTLFFISTQTTVHQNAETAFQKKAAVQDAHRLIEDMRYWAKSGTFPTNVTANFTSTFCSTTIANYYTMSSAGATSEAMTAYYSTDGGTNFNALTSAVTTTGDPMLVKITVTWTGYNRRSMSQDLATYITKRA